MIRKAYADISQGQIHYREHARDESRHSVFLHQTASSSQMWVKVMDGLQGSHCVALDTPGFGGSYDPAGFPALEEYSDVIIEAVDNIGLKVFDIVGHHTGSCLGVDIAARYPERVSSLAMIGPVPLEETERDAFREHYRTPFSPDSDGQYLLDTWNYLQGLGADSDLLLHHREMVDTLRAYYGRFQAYSAVWDHDFIHCFKKVSCPMLLMCAKQDVLYDYFERAKKMRPDAQHAMLNGANFEPDQDPQGTIDALQQFWSKL